ncbi:hypothetical protein EJ110_NYTH07797 [Nymphaea thermarum]|nr:hypothetical protein EJ110_NYTH07797 [Nymphaea thermarum]
MAGGTGEAESRPSVASPMAFLQSTCSCFELVVRGVWGCLVYHLGFGEDCADDRSKKDEREEEEDGAKTGKREANGGSTENFGVMLTRGPKRPGIDVGGGGQVN